MLIALDDLQTINTAAIARINIEPVTITESGAESWEVRATLLYGKDVCLHFGSLESCQGVKAAVDLAAGAWRLPE